MCKIEVKILFMREEEQIDLHSEEGNRPRLLATQNFIKIPHDQSTK